MTRKFIKALSVGLIDSISFYPKSFLSETTEGEMWKHQQINLTAQQIFNK